MKTPSTKDLLIQLVNDISEVKKDIVELKKDIVEVKDRLTNLESEAKKHGWNI